MSMAISLWLAFAWFGTAGAAVTEREAPTPAMDQPTVAMEQEARVLETMLIAPCCWNQQVSVHYSPASDEIRADVRRMLAAGQSRQQILDFYVARYGDRILAEPPARGFTKGLYVLPWVFLVASVTVVVGVIRRLSVGASPEPLQKAALANEGPYGDRLEEELRDMD
jgi:cytochrome c-type biogenesis protein CcmH